MNRNFFDAHAEMGYAYADLGDMTRAQEVVDFLEIRAPALADTLSRYMYKVDPPKLSLVPIHSSFPYYLPMRSPVAAMDTYLQNAGAEKTFTMTFQFDKEMDRESVENVLNWQIGRSTASGLGEAYNFGLPLPPTEIAPLPQPDFVAYDADTFRAVLYFRIRQNADADGTLDPAHVEFKFGGKDVFGLTVDDAFDQFMGFSGVY
jgi:hypothetical protein